MQFHRTNLLEHQLLGAPIQESKDIMKSFPDHPRDIIKWLAELQLASLIGNIPPAILGQHTFKDSS